MSIKTSLLHAVAGLTDLIPRKPFRVLRDLIDLPTVLLSKPEDLWLDGTPRLITGRQSFEHSEAQIALLKMKNQQRPDNPV